MPMKKLLGRFLFHLRDLQYINSAKYRQNRGSLNFSPSAMQYIYVPVGINGLMNENLDFVVVLVGVCMALTIIWLAVVTVVHKKHHA